MSTATNLHTRINWVISLAYHSTTLQQHIPDCLHLGEGVIMVRNRVIVRYEYIHKKSWLTVAYLHAREKFPAEASANRGVLRWISTKSHLQEIVITIVVRRESSVWMSTFLGGTHQEKELEMGCTSVCVVHRKDWDFKLFTCSNLTSIAVTSINKYLRLMCLYRIHRRTDAKIKLM